MGPAGSFTAPEREEHVLAMETRVRIVVFWGAYLSSEKAKNTDINTAYKLRIVRQASSRYQ